MEFNFIASKEKPRLKVGDIALNRWFEIDNVHFIHMGIRDGELRDYGNFVEDNCSVYGKNFLIGGDTGNVVPCLNLEEQMLVYVDCGIIVDDYGDYEMNLFRK